MRARLRKLADVAVAQLALLRAHRRLARAPLGQLTARDDARRDPAADVPRRAFELSRALVLAADHGLFRPRCLVRAIALQELLSDAGIHGSEIRIGVRTGAEGFVAHAWITLGATVLGDDAAHVASFTEVRDLRVLGGR